MEISCCGHCTTTVQEEKQVEEEEEEVEGKGRDSLQSLEESIRPLWGFRHNPATTNLTEIAKATFGVRIQESEKASNLTKTTKVVTPSAPIAATVVWATKKQRSLNHGAAVFDGLTAKATTFCSSSAIKENPDNWCG